VWAEKKTKRGPRRGFGGGGGGGGQQKRPKNNKKTPKNSTFKPLSIIYSLFRPIIKENIL